MTTRRSSADKTPSARRKTPAASSENAIEDDGTAPTPRATPRSRRSSLSPATAAHDDPDTAGGDASADAESAQQAAREKREAALQRWISRMRGFGLSQHEMIWELHVRQGRPLLEIAGALGISLPELHAHWHTLRAQASDTAPKQAADWALLRSKISETLWRTVETTFESSKVPDSGESFTLSSAPAAPLLSIRLKALDQLCKLHGLNLDPDTTTDSRKPYTTPEEIAETVRQRVLELHGREELAEEG